MLQLYTAMQTRIASDETGATMVEYGVILALVSIAAIAVLTLLGADIFSAFDQTENAVFGDQG